MRWFSEPPCIYLSVVEDDDVAGVLRLEGPSRGSRIAGAIGSGFGAVFATAVLRFGRGLPLPLPFRLASLGMAATGGAFAVGSGLAAASLSQVRVTRGEGLHLRWRFVPGQVHESTIAAGDITALEVRTRVGPRSDDDHQRESTHELMVITGDGAAVAIERFATKTQARLRKERIDELLGT